MPEPTNANMLTEAANNAIVVQGDIIAAAREVELIAAIKKERSASLTPAETIETPVTLAETSETPALPEETPVTPEAKPFNAAEALKGALSGGSLSSLKKGSEQRAQVKFAQEMLVETGFLQTTDSKAPNYINPEYFGYMNGNVTVDALKNFQQAMKDKGADIKVDGACFTETWTALAVAKHLGIKDGEISPEAAALYNDIKGDTTQLVSNIIISPTDLAAPPKVAAKS